MTSSKGLSDLTVDEVITGMRACAEGMMADMAAVEILVASPPVTNRWINDEGFRSCLSDVGGGKVYVDWEKVHRLAHRSPASSGEVALLRVASAVAGQPITNLGSDLLSIGSTAGPAMAHAVEYLTGSRRTLY